MMDGRRLRMTSLFCSGGGPAAGIALDDEDIVADSAPLDWRKFPLSPN